MENSLRQIKLLREKVGAGVLDCKKALIEANGNFDKALAFLQAKGFASAAKKASHLTTEGIITSYIHNGLKLGVMIELNCETDFVARRIEFKNLARNLAIQIASCETTRYISYADVPKKEFENALQLDFTTESKDSFEKNALAKKLAPLILLSQPYFQNPHLTVEDYIKTQIALLGENIQIKRFCKYALGEK